MTDATDAQVPDPGAVGHYAGSWSRLAAYAIDALLVSGLYSIVTAGAVWILELVTAQNIDAGTRLLRELLIKYDGDVVKALAATLDLDFQPSLELRPVRGRWIGVREFAL